MTSFPPSGEIREQEAVRREEGRFGKGRVEEEGYFGKGVWCFWEEEENGVLFGRRSDVEMEAIAFFGARRRVVFGVGFKVGE